MSTEEAFWPFSLRIYAVANVADACLALQDEHGLDVNLLLYCCWLGARGSRLDEATLAHVLDFAEPWARHVVRPLRHARAWMKQDREARAELPEAAFSQLRESIKAVELEAERLQQLVAELVAPPPAAPTPQADAPSRAIANLRLYVGSMGVALDAAVGAQLATLVSNATSIERNRAVEQLVEPAGAHSPDG